MSNPGTTLPPVRSALAILGGTPAVSGRHEDLFHWPIITPDDEAAVLAVLRQGTMSGSEVTQAFERQFCAWQGSKFALGFNNGTQALQAAMFACGLGPGDEVIAPSLTYWASILPASSLGAHPVFADIDPTSLCLDPQDLGRRVTSRTKAIVVVHYFGHPADMNAIMAIARRAGAKVIEDVSHAQGGSYRGRRLGSFGHVAAMSLMTGKSLAIGEAGMLVTDDPEIHERAIAFGHYERFDDRIQSPDLRPYAGLPLGGYKNRMHQLSSALGQVQLRSYDARCAEIRQAMNHFWDLLKDVPGLRAHRVEESTGSNMAGWYAPHGHYRPEELGGLSVTRFAAAVRAEGFDGCVPGCNRPLHLHPRLRAGATQPGWLENGKLAPPPDAAPSSLPTTEAIGARTFSIPWFKHHRPAAIAEYAAAFRKVAEHAAELRADDPGNPAELGGWHSTRRA